MQKTSKVLKKLTGGLKVLVVDDDSTPRRMMSKMLKEYFSEVLTASDGKEALEILSKNRINLVITDFYMPVMSGTELLTNIKKNYSNTFVIFMTGAKNTDSVVSFLNLGADGIFFKPLTKDTVLRTLEMVCERLMDRVVREEYFRGMESLVCMRQCDNKQNKKTMVNVDKKYRDFNNKPFDTHHDKSEQHDEPEQHICIPASQSAQQNDDDFDVYVPDTQYHNPMPFHEAYKHYHSTLMPDDIHELGDLLSDMDHEIELVFLNKRADVRRIILLGEFYQKFANALLRYQLFAGIATSLMELSEVMITHVDHVKNSVMEVEQTFCALLSVLNAYYQDVWLREAPNPIIYNESLQNDIGMLITMIAPPREEVEEEEDVFFF